MDNTTIRLIYFLYTPKEKSETYKNMMRIHFNCLNYYKNVFNKAIFILAFDDLNDKELISQTEKEVVELGVGINNIKFIVVQNDIHFRETKYFKSEVVDKLGELDGLTFFAHSKYCPNFIIGEKEYDSVCHWIAESYYFNLNFIEEVKNIFFSANPTYYSYGHLLTNCNGKEMLSTHNWFYSGTFFWINATKIGHLYGDKAKSLNVNDRWFAEFFLSDVFSIDHAYSHCKTLGEICNAYKYSKDILPMIASKDDVENYMSFYNYIAIK